MDEVLTMRKHILQNKQETAQIHIIRPWERKHASSYLPKRIPERVKYKALPRMNIHVLVKRAEE